MSQTAIEALNLHTVYENTPSDRGGVNGPKGKAWKAFIDAKTAALSALPAKAGVSVKGETDRSGIAGLKIALEQAWESNREREERIKSLDNALRNFTDGREISYVDALEEARKLLGDLS